MQKRNRGGSTATACCYLQKVTAVERVQDRNNVCGVPPIYLALRMLGQVQGEQVAYDRCPADEDGTSLVSVCGVVWK